MRKGKEEVKKKAKTKKEIMDGKDYAIKYHRNLR